MSTTNTMPQLDILFKGLGVTALKRAERGDAVLILKDETEGELKKYYKTIIKLLTILLVKSKEN